MKVKTRTGAKVFIHPADAAFAREKGVTVDGDLTYGQRVGPFTVVAAPGKSPGEVALHWPERKILIIGDACVGKPPGACALLPAAAIDDVPKLRESLKQLAMLDFDTLLLGDGACILKGGKAALAALANGA
jgi:glyoxylase-like metal-dependent hydrolase (beta-lactamase superfamily II)